MAKEAKTKNAPSKVTAELLAQSLVEVNLLANADGEGEKVELRYNASIDTPEKLESDKYYFRCNFSVSKRKVEAEEDVQSVVAIYACILQHPSDDLVKVKETAKKYAATSAWNAFASLFALVTHQMRTSFPPLPASPGGIASSGRGSFDHDDVNDKSETV